jgi:hypothetical protein
MMVMMMMSMMIVTQRALALAGVTVVLKSGTRVDAHLVQSSSPRVDPRNILNSTRLLSLEYLSCDSALRPPPETDRSLTRLVAMHAMRLESWIRMA